MGKGKEGGERNGIMESVCLSLDLPACLLFLTTHSYGGAGASSSPVQGGEHQL